MKKRILSLLLGLALLAGLTVPALAAGASVSCDSPADVDGIVQLYGEAPMLEFTITKAEGTVVEEIRVDFYDMNGTMVAASASYETPERWKGQTACIFQAHVDSNMPPLEHDVIYACVPRVTVDGTTYNGETIFFRANSTAPTYTVNFFLDLITLTDLGTFQETNGEPWVLPADPSRPGKTFVGWKLVGGDMIDPDGPVLLTRDDTAFGVFEDAPAASEGQAPDASGMAYASTQTVEVDGRKMTFQMYALRDAGGNDTNYVKLRDVAFALTGTDARFNVEWSAQRGIYVTPGLAYIMVGGEMDTPFSGDRPYTRMNDTTDIDGEAVALQAFTLTDDAGNGYTYYKLRDLGQALGFHVGWSAEQGVYIETGTR